MVETSNIKNLLSQVNTIVNSYEKVAQATGENFNIFSVLGIEHYEEGTHSKFITHLLNAKGNHGFGNRFLEVFIKLIEDIDDSKVVFNTENYRVKTEHVIGPINEDFTKGGRIDILLTDNNGNIIMIENKIYAEEQLKQLLRYRNAYPQGNLIYLTLKGEESKLESSKIVNYIRVSYKVHIIKWLEECHRMSLDNPVLRETIKQYKNLIKKLTLQNINSEMKNEIFKLISDNEDNFSSLIELQKINIKEFIIEQTIKPIILEIGKKYDMKTNIHAGNWPNFTFVNEKLKFKNIKSLCFSSSSKIGHTNMVYGILPNEVRDLEIEKNIKKLFSDYFDAYTGTGYTNWIALGHFNDYRNFEDYNVLKDIQLNKSDFKDAMDEKIRTMINIIDQV